MLNRSRPADDDRILARCYAELAILTKERGDFDESLSYHRKSMEIFQRIDEPLDVADRHLDIAQIYKVKGEFRRAMTEYEKGLTLYEDTLIESTDSGLEFSQNSSSFFGTENAKFLSKSQQISSSSSIFDEESNDEQFTEFSFGQIFDAEKRLDDFDKSKGNSSRKFELNFFLIFSTFVLLGGVFLYFYPQPAIRNDETIDDLSKQLNKYLTWSNERFRVLSKSDQRILTNFIEKTARRKLSLENFQKLVEKLQLKLVLVPR